MAKIDIPSRIAELATSFLAAHDLVLWGVDAALGGGRGGVLRIFIDTPAGASGAAESVTIDQCAELSRQLSVTLDVEDFIRGSYRLEVSSPGLDRRFFSLEQVVPFLGRDMELMLFEPRDGRKKFRGHAITADDGILVLEVDGARLHFPWAEVKSVRLVPNF
ncbi:ribosome maturation factor RimP [Desulfovibrio inopinatus]|uniref:ribosome maturation factor RimP n=1 Tax=Desulfovibrio inopinatus TaxID=102109 RepID=UPI00041A8737|nr:ribosome maturation factor RimP [Desulfovibrio inopinatus]